MINLIANDTFLIALFYSLQGTISTGFKAFFLYMIIPGGLPTIVRPGKRTMHLTALHCRSPLVGTVFLSAVPADEIFPFLGYSS